MVENFKGDVGYVSEKIFDTLLSDAVPVYLGDRRVHEDIPRTAYVDVNEFESISSLIAHLRDCSEEDWKTMKTAGKEFLSSKRALRFSDEAFAEKMMRVLRDLVPQERGG